MKNRQLAVRALGFSDGTWGSSRGCIVSMRLARLDVAFILISSGSLVFQTETDLDWQT
jgi:hypothetical protein